MKSLLLAVLAAAVLAPAPGFAQNPIEGPQERESYRIGMRQELDKLGERVSALELRARVGKPRGREDLQARNGELRARKKAADELFGRIETGTDAERRVARARLDEAVRGLRTAVEQAEGARRD
jgi:hypothetical protein